LHPSGGRLGTKIIEQQHFGFDGTAKRVSLTPPPARMIIGTDTIEQFLIVIEAGIKETEANRGLALDITF
jgi:hypothetical protein